MMALRPVIAVTLALALATLALAAAAPQRSRIARLDRRLEALAPTDPMAYFELAEEIADAAETAAQRDLARHLFALAGMLDERRLGRSACLALADLADDDNESRRLLALAWLLDSGVASVPGSFGARPAEDPDAALAVVQALSHFRRGHGGKALRSLKTPGAMAIVEHYSHAFRGGADRFLADCKAYGGGKQKPSLSFNEVSRMLQLEAALLSGGDRSWSGDLIMSRGEPLVEVDPTRLAETLRVDPGKPYHRDGRWVAR